MTKTKKVTKRRKGQYASKAQYGVLGFFNEVSSGHVSPDGC